MRFRTGLLMGLAAGYYFGTKAGRERYEQIEQWLDKLQANPTVQEARTKLSDGFREGATVARRKFEEAAENLGGSDSAEAPGAHTDQVVGQPTYN